MTGAVRVERDSMGELEVPADALYGANTRRAELNFPISDLRFNRSFIRAIGQVKQSAAVVNLDLGQLDPELSRAIVDAAQEVIDGKHDDAFVVDIFQTGSGTSTNMNANEVISNVANRALGSPLGSRSPVHPNDHVNKGQSSNDVIPTCIHLAAAGAIQENLLPAMDELENALRDKSVEFWDVIKTGRTHLQDATPVRLGQEFLGYAGQMSYGRVRVESALSEMCVLALGGTAVGTGIGMHPEFSGRMIERLRELTGLDLSETANHFQAQSAIDGVVAASGSLKTVSASLLKICNDLRWLGSGPRAGIGEIELPGSPARQLDNARQGQPGDRGVGDYGLRQGHGQRRDDQRLGPVRQLRTERHDAGGGVLPAGVDRPAGGVVPEPISPVRNGHHGHRTRPRHGRAGTGHLHRPRSQNRLRRGRRHRSRGGCVRRDHQAGGPARDRPVLRRTGPHPGPCGHDGARRRYFGGGLRARPNYRLTFARRAACVAALQVPEENET